jgi:hypothetical protein
VSAYVHSIVYSGWSYTREKKAQSLRDFAGELRTLSGGKIPLARTVCGLRTIIAESDTKIHIPFVPENKFWNTPRLHGTCGTKGLNFDSFNLSDWDALHSNAITDAKSWAASVPLAEDLGAGGAVMI